MTKTQFTWIFISILAMAGIGLWNWPHPVYQVPSDQENHATNDQTVNLKPALLLSFINRFDHATLPEPVTPSKVVPVIDPMAELKGWILTGVVHSGDKTMALFARGNVSVMREIGDELAGFTIENITPRQVLFHHETLTHQLNLPQVQEQKITLNQNER